MKTLDLIFELPITYAFSGNDRDADAAVAADTAAGVTLVNVYPGGSVTHIPGGTPVRINRARLLSPGYDNLQCPPGKTAAEIKFSFVGGFTPVPAEFSLEFVRWNEWENKDIAVDIGDAQAFDVNILSSSVVRLDDYNIEDAYMNQNLKVLVELEIQVSDKGRAIIH